MEPSDFRNFVKNIKDVKILMGNSKKEPTTNECLTKILVRKSIVAKKNILKDELFNYENLTFKRPGDGISPMKLWDLLGTKAKRDFKIDELIEI